MRPKLPLRYGWSGRVQSWRFSPEKQTNCILIKFSPGCPDSWKAKVLPVVVVVVFFVYERRDFVLGNFSRREGLTPSLSQLFLYHVTMKEATTTTGKKILLNELFAAVRKTLRKSLGCLWRRKGHFETMAWFFSKAGRVCGRIKTMLNKASVFVVVVRHFRPVWSVYCSIIFWNCGQIMTELVWLVFRYCLTDGTGVLTVFLEKEGKGKRLPV